MWNLKPYQWAFHTVLIKIRWPVLYFEWIFCPYKTVTSGVAHLENIGSLSYADTPNVDTFYYTMFKKSYLLTSLQMSSETILTIGKLSSSWWWILILPWKLKFYHWEQTQSFSLKWHIHTVHFWGTCLLSTRVWIIRCLSVILSSKNDILGKECLGMLATWTTAHVFSSSNFGIQQKGLCKLPM